MPRPRVGAEGLSVRRPDRGRRGVAAPEPYLAQVGEACEISWAVAAVAALDARCRRTMYGRAVAFGVANTQCSSERERQFGALRLLTLATLRLPDVALYGELLHAHAAERRACCLVTRP